MDQLLQFAGRLHPLVLHAPIGFAVVLMLLEVLFLVRRKSLPRDIRAPLAWLTALAAGTAIASGLLLQEEGGHNADTIWLHQWLSISVGVCCLAAAVFQQLGRRVLYTFSLALGVIILIPAGHFGATMTHGDNFLTEPFFPADVQVVRRDSSADATAGPGATSHYAGVIAPILESRCYGCHGSERDKGSLRLHTPESILAGGDAGPVIVAGNADASDLFRRLSLPLDDDDHMPPRSKPQPTAEEIAAIKAWIAAGAAFDVPSTTPGVDRASGPNNEPPAARPPAPTPDPAAIEAIRARLAHIEPIARDTHLLLIDFSAIAPSVDDDALASLLTPLREHIADVNLSRTRITDASLSFLATLPELRRLNLSSTPITDQGLRSLADHPALAELVLTQTKLTDIAYDTLVSLPALTNVYLWKSGVTGETIAELRSELPTVVFDAGDTPDAIALDTETEIKLTNAAASPAAQAPPAPTAGDSLKPVNTVCPVAGKPIDPDFAIVHKGRVIAFCCRHCVASFLEDPEKYEAAIK